MANTQPDNNLKGKSSQLANLENCLTLVENSLTGMAVVQDYKIVFSNPKMIEIMGYSLEEASAYNISAFIHPDDRQRVLEYYRKRIAGEPAPEQYEFKAVSKKGETRILEMRPTVIQYGGRPAVLMNVIDITDRYLNGQELKKREEEYRSLIESIYDWIWEINDQLVYTYTSPQVKELLGYEPEEIIGRSPFDLMQEEEAERVKSAFAPIFEKREAFTLFENTILHADGHRVIVETSGRPVFDNQGAFRGYRGIDRDITARKLAEESLRSSERRLADIINFLPDATFAIDIQGRVISWNREMEKLTGVDAEAILGKGNYEYALPFYGVRRPVLADLVLDPREEVKKLYPFITEVNETLVTEIYVPSFGPEGSYLWAKASPLRDVRGKIVGAIESVRDITERKRAEENRRELEKRLDAQKRQFYRETILSVTDGKLEISDAPMIARHLSRADKRFEITSGEDAARARHEVAAFLRQHGLTGPRQEELIMGVGEAIANAVKHADGGRVYMGVTGEDSVWVGVTDKGSGMEALILPRATLLKGFSTKPSLGLGYSIILEVSDQVLLRTGSRGTVVILIKKLQEPTQAMPRQLPDTWDGIPTP